VAGINVVGVGLGWAVLREWGMGEGSYEGKYLFTDMQACTVLSHWLRPQTGLDNHG